MVLYFVRVLNDVTTQVTGKSAYSVKGIHVNNGESVCAIASHKIHVLMKFIEIDETSVNLLHNPSKSDPQKPQKFQSSQETLH